MIFSPSHTNTSELEIKLNGITLSHTNNTKLLGTWIDEKLVWGYHLKNLKTKLLSKLGLLRKSKKLLSTHAIKSLYYAQIHSNINYALVLWGPMAKYRDIKQIESIQNKALQCIEENSRVELHIPQAWNLTVVKDDSLRTLQTRLQAVQRSAATAIDGGTEIRPQTS